MIVDLRHRQRKHTASLHKRSIREAYQQSHFARFAILRKMDAQFLWPDGDRLANWPPHHHWIREIHHVDDHPFLLLPRRDVDESRAGNRDGTRLVEAPADDIRENSTMIRIEHLPER